MWSSDAGRQDPGSQTAVFPTKQQLKEAMMPPSTKELPKQPGPVLNVQILICLLLVATTAAAQHFKAPWYSAFCQQYQNLTTQGIDLAQRDEMVRFAGKMIDDVKIYVQEWEDAFTESRTDNAQSLTGKGGQNPRKDRQLPPGHSLKSYIPQQPLQLPVTGFVVTSPYGWRDHPLQGGNDFHSGIDLAVAEGTPIVAALDGVVLDTKRGPSYGNYVLLMHNSGEATRYCHMQYVFVKPGESVSQGDILGTVGHTGMATGPHLHFELMRNNICYDPDRALGL